MHVTIKYSYDVPIISLPHKGKPASNWLFY